MKLTILSFAICCISFSFLNAQQLPDPVTGNFTDPRDGKTYRTVRIGNQVWMAENLAFLPSVSPSAYGSDTDPYYYVYDYQGTDVTEAKATTNYSTYGVMYNWPAALTACPAGWHLPSDAEWTTMTDYLTNNGYGYEGSGDDIAKSMAATTNWYSDSTPGTPGNDPASNNSSGFSGLPGGHCSSNGYFYVIEDYGNWWSSTENSTFDAWYRSMYYRGAFVYRANTGMGDGFSVRCLRDESNVADTLSINLKNGWNIFSTNVIPDSIDLKTLFKGLIDDGNLLKIQDESGNAVEDIGDYGDWVNQIGNIALTEGYRIEVNDSVNIQFVGEQAVFPFEIPLKAGWNIIGYPGSSDMDALEVVQQLIDRQTLIMVQDEDGNTLVNNESTGEWVNGIGDFKPGKGYKVRVISDDILLFGNLPPELPFNPSPSDSAVSVEPTTILSWACNDPEGDQLTYDFYRGTSPESLVFIKDDLEGNSFYSGLLQYGTVYYWKVIATDSHGNSTEGPLWTLRVRNETGSFTDSRDNNTYQTVKIGDRWWMAENLAWLPSVSPPADGSSTDPYYSIYGYEGTDVTAAKATTNYSTYGVLYNWPAALTACPVGWHLPSDAEWTTMTDYLTNNGYGYEGSGDDIAKSVASTTNWYSYSTPGTPGNDPGSNNSSGFSGLPGGYRDSNVGYFYYIGYIGYWWSSTEGSASNAWFRYLNYNLTNVNRDSNGKGYGFSVRCLRDPVSAPSVSTSVPDSITNNSVVLGGEVTFDGWADVTERGVCYGTTQTPTTENTKVAMDSGIGSFNGKITGLAANTTYYARAYAINSQGTAYGDEVTFATLADNGTFVDSRDGNEYDWVKIGDQVWMAENLAWLPAVSPPADGSSTDPYYYVYGYKGTDVTAAKATTNYSTYGVLYNWPAALTACPAGWHLPSDAEWTTLTDYLINNDYGYEGSGDDIAKSMAATTNWYSDIAPGAPGNDLASNNSSGFSGLPGGYRDYDVNFGGIGTYGIWWSSTESSPGNAWCRYLYYGSPLVGRLSRYKESGSSVRCLRDPVSAPSVITSVPDSITNNSAVLGGEVTFDGWADVTERGVCYGTTQTPTTENGKVAMDSGIGSFNGKITGLAANTTYYARAYAINSQGTAYGDEVTFATLADNGTFVDSRDGNEYDWVKIGDQVWMAENLAWLPSVNPSASESGDPYYYVYDYQGTDVAEARATTNYSTYGVLYNWPAALTACPAGWHLPSDAEWTTMTDYLINNGYGFEGSGDDIAKSMAATTNWNSYSEPGTPGNDPGSNNSSGFSGLPGGGRLNPGSFYDIGLVGYWWSSTESLTVFAWCRFLGYSDARLLWTDDWQVFGFSVRCLRDF